jgi:CRP-like cAMP-binding protein
MMTDRSNKRIQPWRKVLPEALCQAWLDAGQWIEWPLRHREPFTPQAEPYVYWLQSGLVKVGRFLPNQREDYQYLARAGEWIGELSLVEPAFPPFFAMTATPSQLLRLPRLLVQQSMMAHPSFNLMILEQLGHRLRATQQRREAMIYQSTRFRILAFLCDYCEQHGEETDGVIHIQHPLNHTDISKFTATSRQSVHTLMADLRRQQRLNYDPHHLQVPRRTLQQFRQQMRHGAKSEPSDR